MNGNNLSKTRYKYILEKKKKLCKNNLILKDQDKYIFPICDVFFSVLRL